MNIGKIYSGYLSFMARLGRMTRRAEHALEAHTARADATADGKLPTDTDAEATRVGNQYRALGTFVGFLGIAIVFLAIAPSGWELGHETEHVLGLIKVALMVLMLLIVLFGGSSQIKRNWMALRSEAEAFRYMHLYAAFKELQHSADPAVHARLREGLIAVLEGKNGQVAYDFKKARQYGDIESFSDVLLWTSVWLALGGAVLHLFVPYNWLIFFTAFGPALVGGVHGINAFLCVGDLAKKHATAATELQRCLRGLQASQAANNTDVALLLRQAAEALKVLTDRDTRWYALVEDLGIKPA